MKEKFILPETWFVRVNNLNRAKLCLWRFGNLNYLDYLIKSNTLFIGMYKFKSFDRPSKEHSDGSDFINWGTEISFDQFKKYVLKEEPIIEPPKDYTYLIKILEKL